MKNDYKVLLLGCNSNHFQHGGFSPKPYEPVTAPKFQSNEEYYRVVQREQELEEKGETTPVDPEDEEQRLNIYHDFTSFKENIAQVCCGSHHTLILTTSGIVYSSGLNEHGACGFDSSVKHVETFRPISTIPAKHRITFIASRMSHSILLTDSGRCIVFGNNLQGQIGTKDRSTFVPPTVLSKRGLFNGDYIAAVSCGPSFTFFMNRSGREVWVVGSNGTGQLGLNHMKNMYQPKLLKCTSFFKGNKESISSIYCGDEHALILSNKGRVYACGSNAVGQLGLGKKLRKVYTFFAVEFSKSRVAKISATATQSAFLTEHGELYVTGDFRATLPSAHVSLIFSPLRVLQRCSAAVTGNGRLFVQLSKSLDIQVSGYNSKQELGIYTKDSVARTLQNAFTRLPKVWKVKHVCFGAQHTIVLLSTTRTLFSHKSCSASEMFQILKDVRFTFG